MNQSPIPPDDYLKRNSYKEFIKDSLQSNKRIIKISIKNTIRNNLWNKLFYYNLENNFILISYSNKSDLRVPSNNQYIKLVKDDECFINKFEFFYSFECNIYFNYIITIQDD